MSGASAGWFVAARGATASRMLTLLVGFVAPILASHVHIEMGVLEVHGISARTLNNGVLVGLTLPVCVLASLLGDRAAWLQQQGVRRLVVHRTGWALALTGAAVVVGVVTALAAGGVTPFRLAVADTLLLWGLALCSAVVAGVRWSWVLPSWFALSCSVPGLLPLTYNYPVLPDHAGTAGAVAAVLMLVGIAAYAVLDDWRLNGGAARSLRGEVDE